MITMSDGSWKRIDEILPGDEILSWVDGEYVKDVVRDVWSAGIKPVVRVSCSGLPDIVSTKDHRFHINDSGRKQRFQEIETIAQKGKTGSRDNLSIYSFMEAGYNFVPHAELYGHLVTDGSVHEEQSPKYTNTKRELVDRVCELSTSVGVTPTIRTKGNGWDIGLSNGTIGGGETKNPLKELFRQEDALHKRSLRRIPKSLWKADHKSLCAFFGAVIDGDGSLWIFEEKTAFGDKKLSRAAEVKIHAGESESLAWDYYWLLRKIGVLASRVSFEKDSCWTVRIWTAESVLALLSQVRLHHKDKEKRRIEILTSVTEKKKRKTYSGLYIASASLSEDGISETWDIETEKFSRFFANGYLVHNSGKDEVFLHHTACSAHRRVGNYWYMLPEYSQARKSMWDAVNPHTGKKRIDEAFPPEIRSFTKEHEMMIGFKSKSTFQLVGSDNFNSLVGSPPVGLVFSEYALSNPSAWGYLMPIVEENGGWVGFNSTPRGKNHFKNLFQFAENEKDWFCQSLTADQTKVFTREQLENIRKQLRSTHGDEYGDALWMQEYYVSFDAAIPGSFWGDCIVKAESEGRIDYVMSNPAYPAFTAWDLGFTDDTSIWFYQIYNGQIHVFDFHESTGKDIPFYAELLRTKAKEFDVKWSTHWLPHDARARTLAAGGKSIQQQLENEKVGTLKIARRLDHQEGIQAARATFPFCRFDKKRCENGIEALRSYHREWDEDKQKFNDSPVHDWSSHASSAFRTLSLSWQTPRESKDKKPISIEELVEKSKIEKQTFGFLKNRHLQKKKNERLYQ